MSTAVDTRPADDDADGVDPRIRARRELVARARQRRRRRWVFGVLAVATRDDRCLVRRRAPRCSTSTRSRSSARPTPATTTYEPHPGCESAIRSSMSTRARSARGSWRCPGSPMPASSASWGGDVVLRIRERVPVAMFSDARGNPMLVDGEGMVVAPAAMPDADLVAVQGVVAGAPGESVAGADGALAVVNALTPGVRSRVETLVVAPDGQIQLKVRPSGVVDLCEPVDVAAKIRSLQTVFAQVDDRGLESLSVCVPDQPTERRHG